MKKILKGDGKLKMAKGIDFSKILDEKDLKILQLLIESPEGLRRRTIERQTHIPTRTVYNHLKKLCLKKVNLLKNITPIYKINKLSEAQEILATLSKSYNITNQGHHITYVLPLVNKPDWWDKRKDRLMCLKEWAFKKDVTANNNQYYQIQKKGYMQIQTYKNSIYFICQRDYRESSDLEIFNKSKDDVLDAIRYLEEQLRFNFLIENYFHLTFVDAHYVSIKDALAEVCFEQNKRFKIETKEGYYLWVDFSDPRGLEGNNPEVKRRYLEFIKDVVNNPEIKLPSQLQREIIEFRNESLTNIKNLSQDGVNVSLVIKQLQSEIRGLTELVYIQQQEINELKKDKI